MQLILNRGLGFVEGAAEHRCRGANLRCTSVFAQCDARGGNVAGGGDSTQRFAEGRDEAVQNRDGGIELVVIAEGK